MIALKVTTFSIFSVVGVLLSIVLIQLIIILSKSKKIIERLELLTDIKGWLNFISKIKRKKA